MIVGRKQKPPIAREREISATRHLLSLSDIGDADFAWIVKRGCSHANGMGTLDESLAGRIVGIYFTKPSTRTRTAFTTAALRLGARVITYDSSDLQVATGETMTDTGCVLARMLDALVIRTAGEPAHVRELAMQGRMPVINAMTADEHPTQALSDLTFLYTRFGGVDGLRLLYIGEGNNTAAALCLALARHQRVEIFLRTPLNYGLPASVAQSVKRISAVTGTRIDEQHHLKTLPRVVDVVYATRWQTTGTVKQNSSWRTEFEPFQITEGLMEKYPHAIFMHDLPAHRGEEVSPSVIDGPASVVFDQAECKLYSAMGVLEWSILGRLHA